MPNTTALTFHDAEAVIERVQQLMNPDDFAGVTTTFAADAAVRLDDLPDAWGRPPLETFLMARFARQKNHRLQKQLRAVSDNIVACTWEGEWDDGQSGRRMQGRGFELLTTRGGEITRWEAVFNVAPKAGTSPWPLN
jgi:nuclear transport factor 2 (NTF2) superfamily protein